MADGTPAPEAPAAVGGLAPEAGAPVAGTPVPAPPPVAAAAQPAAASSLLTDAPAEGAATPPAPAPTEGEGEKGAAITAESYADFALPEGVTPDPAVMDSFRAVAAEHGLSQEAAQSLLDLHAQSVASQAEAHVAATQQWATDAKADKEFGGAGFDASMGLARKALQAYGSPELGQLLAQSGLGNHPEIIRTFYRMGKTLSEDPRVGGGGASARGNPLDTLYPTMAKG